MGLLKTSTSKKGKGQRVKSKGHGFTLLYPKPFTLNPSQKGFTLIELVIVIAIFSIVATFGLFLSMDFYRTYNSNIAITKIVSVLSKARAQSLANINEKEHGVHIDEGKYILFSRVAPAIFGLQAPEDLEIPAGSGVNLATTDIIFERLTGKARNSISACPCYVEIESQGVTKTITVNSEGGIDW